MLKLSTFFSIFCLYHSITAVLCAVVNLDGGGVTGLLDITPISETTANFKFRHLELSGINVRDLTLAVHTLPPVYHGTCREEEVGSIYDPTNAFNDTNYNVTCALNSTTCAVGDLGNRLGKFAVVKDGSNTTIPDHVSIFNGFNSIVGRTLVVYDGLGEPVTCAVIRNHTADDMPFREIVVETRFLSPVGGVVIFSQIVDDNAAVTYDTQIQVYLFTNDGTSSTESYDWYLVKATSSHRHPSEQPLIRTCKDGRCFSPHLSRKHGYLNIPPNRGRRYFFTDSNLPLDDTTNMSLVIVNHKMAHFSSASLRPRLGVVAKFNDDVTGYISVHPSVVGSVLRINLTGLAGQAGEYHVHRFPVINGDCSTTGGHFNPFGMNSRSSKMNGSSDQFEAGDLGGLFGSLAKRKSVKFTAFSRNLATDGTYGILGRSIVIHHTNKSMWQCATLEPLAPQGQNIIKHTAVARFEDDVKGYVKMTQYQIAQNILTDTIVEIDLRQDGNATVGHKWHVHQNSAAGYRGISMENCASRYAGGHYNPERVDLKNSYSSDCHANNQFRCEVGDMSGKHGKYTLHPLDSSLGRKLFQDASLPLTGQNAVIHRSVVLHAANGGGGRIACANLYPQGTRRLSVTFRKPDIVDRNDIIQAIADSLSIPKSDVRYTSLAFDELHTCVSVTFAVPDAVFETLNGQNFASYLVDRGGTCGHYILETECLDRRNVDKNALAVVHVNGNGIMGQVDIDGMLDGTVLFRIRSLKQSGESHGVNLTVAIHELPPVFREACDETTVGPVYDPTKAIANADYANKCRLNKTECAVGDLRRRLGAIGLGHRVTVFPDHNFLRGQHSIIGRSLVVYNASSGLPITCSSILRRYVGTAESMPEISLKAKLLAPIAGTVTFTQSVNKRTGKTYETQILLDVFSNKMPMPKRTYIWQLTDSKIRDVDGCKKVAHAMTKATCNAKQTDKCRFTDLSSKHGRLTIPWGRGHRQLYADVNLPLENITDMTLVISDDSASKVSCSPVKRRIGTRAKFTGNVNGDIMCIPKHGGSRVIVKLFNLQRLAERYHVHEYPVTDGDCYSTGAHFNPYNITKFPSSRSSDDQYEEGDLSSLFGSLTNQTSVSFERVAHNLNCDRILGRSIVIHYVGGKRWQCATLEPVLSGETNKEKWTKHSAVAHFADHYRGYVKLTQWEHGSGSFFTDTVIDVNVNVKGESTGKHQIHVHQKPVAAFDGMFAKNCQANFTGGHYNPLEIDYKETYKRECDDKNQMRCEVGDLSGKHGLFTFHSVGNNGRRLMTDQLLPLTGRHSVMLRSIVIHAAENGAARIACATLYPEGHKPFSVTLSNSPTLDITDLRMSIARGLRVSPEDVKYLSYKVEASGTCGSATFVLPESTANSLRGNDFLSSLSSNGTFGNYAANSSCMMFLRTTTPTPSSGGTALTTLSLVTVVVVLVATTLF